jgi:Sulfotransferase family
VIIITGCGRSGTTLCLKLLTSDKPCFKLDEPRELYMSLMGEQFDIWSVKSKTRNGLLKPAAIQTSFVPVLRALSTDAPIHYIEKTPEHIFRLEQISILCPSAKFIYIQRNWISVALSIWEITDQSRKPIRWYGAGGCKWTALARGTPFEKV